MKDQELHDIFHAYRPEIDDEDAFMDKLIAQMDAIDAQQQTNESRAKQQPRIVPFYRRILPWAMGIAAAVLVAFVLIKGPDSPLVDSPPALPVREGAECVEQASALSPSKVTAPSLTGRAGGESAGGESAGRRSAGGESTMRGSSFALAIAAAAIFAAVAFLIIVPRVKERKELARYEGSYTVVDGQRIDDLGRIKADISEALAMAQMAEDNVPARDFATEAERAILQATDDPEMQAVVQRILKE